MYYNIVMPESKRILVGQEIRALSPANATLTAIK